MVLLSSIGDCLPSSCAFCSCCGWRWLICRLSSGSRVEKKKPQHHRETTNKNENWVKELNSLRRVRYNRPNVHNANFSSWKLSYVNFSYFPFSRFPERMLLRCCCCFRFCNATQCFLSVTWLTQNAQVYLLSVVIRHAVIMHFIANRPTTGWTNFLT